MAFLRSFDVPANLHLAVTNSCIETNLRMHRRAVYNLSISHCKLRAVPWTLDDAVVKRARGQRAAQMSAFLGQCEHCTATFYQNNRNSVQVGPVGFVFLKFSFS